MLCIAAVAWSSILQWLFYKPACLEGIVSLACVSAGWGFLSETVKVTCSNWTAASKAQLQHSVHKELFTCLIKVQWSSTQYTERPTGQLVFPSSSLYSKFINTESYRMSKVHQIQSCTSLGPYKYKHAKCEGERCTDLGICVLQTKISGIGRLMFMCLEVEIRPVGPQTLNQLLLVVVII